jgi:hypothetical protein
VRVVPSTQLLVYSFGPGAQFEGQLVGALERVESGGGVRIMDVLFLRSDAETGELSAFAPKGGGGRIVAPVLDFRLDERRRRQATERTLRDGTGGMSGDEVRALAAGLEPGCSVAAVLLEHVWAEALRDAASRTSGTAVANRFVDATELTAELLAEHLRG